MITKWVCFTGTGQWSQSGCGSQGCGISISVYVCDYKRGVVEHG